MTAMTARCDLRTWVRAHRATAPITAIAAIAAVVASAAVAPPRALAQEPGRPPEQGPRVVVRAYYLVDSFSHSEAAMGVDTFTTVSYHGKPGGGVDLEYLFTPFVGLDVAASQTHIQADEVFSGPVFPTSETKGKIQVRPFTLGLYGHFYRAQHLDAYIGPFVGLVQMSGGSFRPSDTEFAFGAVLGLDVPLGESGLALSGVGRVLSSRFPDQLRPVSHFRDNFLFGGGLAWRF